ncbi:MAG: helix-turn-helix transcriptional regulator [Actinomycetota bacterium]
MGDAADHPGHDDASWSTVRDRLLTGWDRGELAPDQLDQLAEARFWLNDPQGSIEVWMAAHRGWLDADRPDRAVRAAWRLFYEHWLVGEAAVARGWLARARRLVTDEAGGPQGWLALAEADVAAADGDLAEAVALAARAQRIGTDVGDDDLRAMGLQAEGRHLIAAGDRTAGLARLDEAMISVIGDPLDPLFVGWIYCNVISTCHAVGDLRRANEWSVTALRWCASLRDGRLYPGLCRVYAAELACLRGDLVEAEQSARQACDDLLAFDRRYAGAAHHLLGEVCRLQGRRDEAAASFAAAEELGHRPQPGLALLRADQGVLDEAVAALRSAAAAESAPLPRLQLLSALVEVADRAGDRSQLAAAVAETEAAAEVVPSELGSAYGAAARGRLAAGLADADTAAAELRAAAARFDELGLELEAARARARLAEALADAGDRATAELAAAAAARVLADLEATASDGEATAAKTMGPPLTERERTVLALVAGGATNRDVAERLHLSHHTVARHLANSCTKLGVRGRAAAVAAAYARGLLD